MVVNWSAYCQRKHCLLSEKEGTMSCAVVVALLTLQLLSDQYPAFGPHSRLTILTFDAPS